MTDKRTAESDLRMEVHKMEQQQRIADGVEAELRAEVHRLKEASRVPDELEAEVLR